VAHLQTIRIAGTEYVIVSKTEFQNLSRKAGIPAGSVDALEYGRNVLGAKLREARDQAKLTQIELARKLRKSQALVSGAESGRVRVSDRYVASVLRACKLPADWSGFGSRRRPRRTR
jgi:ribosome-binding protein aMBF1 (putative translation factor)